MGSQFEGTVHQREVMAEAVEREPVAEPLTPGHTSKHRKHKSRVELNLSRLNQGPKVPQPPRTAAPVWNKHSNTQAHGECFRPITTRRGPPNIAHTPPLFICAQDKNGPACPPQLLISKEKTFSPLPWENHLDGSPWSSAQCTKPTPSLSELVKGTIL